MGCLGYDDPRAHEIAGHPIAVPRAHAAARMTPADRTQHHSPTIRDRAAPGLGLVLMASGFVIMSLTDGVAKFLADNVPPGEVAWARFLFQSILAVPLVVAATGWRSLIPYRPAANALRGVLLSTATAMFFIGLKKIPLADSAAIFFILPFLLTILSVLSLIHI